MKADKWQELSNLMHRSSAKVSELKLKQRHEQREYRRTKRKHIKETERMVKHEHLRILEETQFNTEVKE